MAKAEEFVKSIDNRHKLAKRVYFGKDSAAVPLRLLLPMDKSSTTASDYLLPSALIVYVVIYNPTIVDNPNVPSYQSHVHELAADCLLDTAFFKVRRLWMVHCIMGCRS